MTGEEIRVVVRKPLADIEQDVRKRFGVTTPLLETSIEPDALVLTFEGSRRASGDNTAASQAPTAPTGDSEPSVFRVTRRRRSKRRVRLRMKTRGWDVLAKFKNSRGQTCTIYRPIYDALSSRKLRRREAYSEVRRVLVANGNDPKPASVEYFLNNTLEYLSTRSTEAKGP